MCSEGWKKEFFREKTELKNCIILQSCYPVTYMLSRFSCISLFATLWTLAHQAPLFMGFSRQEYWSELPCPPPGDLPDPGIKPYLLCLLHCRRVLCVTSTAWEALSSNNRLYFWLNLEPPVKK